MLKDWTLKMISFGKFFPIIALAFLVLGIIFPLEALAGGYYLTDKDGKVISDTPVNAIVTGPTDQTIILNDRGNQKVFELTWDAEGSAVMVKGERIHLKIHSNGNIEKWTNLENKDQYPINIGPVVPIVPLPK
jgi:hypothetical protein